jgi:arsenate reductase
MEEIVVYEKPTCSKCRVALQVLDEHGAVYRTVRYHDAPLSVKKLTELIRKIGGTAKEVVRKDDPQFKKLKLNLKEMTDAEAIRLMVKYPDLMQRPILERGDEAIVGRPSEKILEFLEG